MSSFSAMELLIQELRLQRDAQLRHFEALDTRAGIVLAFAGAIATFSPLGGLYGLTGRALAIVAALFSLASFIPRGFPVLSVDALLRARPADGSVGADHLLRWLAWSTERSGRVLRTKSKALSYAVVSIGSATVVLGGAIIIAGGAL